MVSNRFYANYGGPVFKNHQLPDTLFFHAGTLDDQTAFQPKMVVHVSPEQP